MISPDERSRELAALRLRAYGPDADIHNDPEAMRRLHELEELTLPARTEAVVADEARPERIPEDAASITDPVLQPESTPGAAEAGSGLIETVPAPAESRRWWRIRSLWAVAAVSLMVGLAVGAAGIRLSSPPPPDQPDQTLAVVGDSTDQSIEWTASLSTWGVAPSSVIRYQSFDTVDVWVGQAAPHSRCLLLSHMGRIFTEQCATQGLDPLLDLTVDSGLPVHFDRSMPAGTVIRFVARAEGVDVWVRGAAIEAVSAVP